MVHTEVYVSGPTQFNMVGQVTHRPVQHQADQSISKGLAERLYRYADKRLNEEGFGPLANGAKVTVYTIDGDDSPADRSYCVRWHTPQGGYVELVGILTRSGWPTLNHGFCIGYEAHREG